MFVELHANQEIIVAVLGGDGSLGCFIDMIIYEPALSENLDKIYFTGLPFGTGNDTGRSLGWGNSEGKLAINLEYMVSSLIYGKREKFALWEAEFDADETQGYKNSKRYKVSEDGQNFKKTMCCYFNIGLDAVISNCNTYIS